MTGEEIQPGHCYWYCLAGLPQRRAFVDHPCSRIVSDLFWTWDIESGMPIVLSAADFVRCCDDEVNWYEIAKLAPEHSFALGIRPQADQLPR